jgi:hypothetical protein
MDNAYQICVNPAWFTVAGSDTLGGCDRAPLQVAVVDDGATQADGGKVT